MAKVLKLILREIPIGREATPWLEPQRKRLTQAAKEIAQELKGSKLKGASKIRAMNRLMRQKLKG